VMDVLYVMDFRPPCQGLPHLDHYSCHIIIVHTSAVTPTQPQPYTQHDKYTLMYCRNKMFLYTTFRLYQVFQLLKWLVILEEHLKALRFGKHYTIMTERIRTDFYGTPVYRNSVSECVSTIF
jgi:hypothetical protein